MAARQLAAQLNRLGDREDRRMAIGFVGDAERVEASEQLVGSERRRSHGGTMLRSGRKTQAPGQVLAKPLPRCDMDLPDAGVAQG